MSLLASYVAAVLVNAARIAIAMWLADHPVGLSTFTAAEVHRLEGIVVYFGGLVLLCELVRRLDRRAAVARAHIMSRALSTRGRSRHFGARLCRWPGITPSRSRFRSQTARRSPAPRSWSTHLVVLVLPPVADRDRMLRSSCYRPWHESSMRCPEF